MSSEGEDRRAAASPKRHLRSPSYLSLRDREQAGDHRSNSRNPNRRRGRLNRYLDELEVDLDRRGSSRSPSPSPRRRRRSPSAPSRRLAPRSYRGRRSRSRSRSRECQGRGWCCQCRRRPADDELYMTPAEDDFYVRIDRSDDLFRCIRCADMLSSPVYECVEGHLTCVACHGSANNGDDGEADRCVRCGSTEYMRSLAVANWLRSIRFSCRYYDYSCPAFLPRRQMEDHERACPHAPVFCPVPRCDFHGGPTDVLERHLTARHGWSVADMNYGEALCVLVHPSRCVLRAEDGALFHLTAAPERGGTALSMIHIRPDNAAAAEFTYEVKMPVPAGPQPQRHRLKMQSTVWGTTLRDGGAADANPISVTVPDDMFPEVEGPQQDCVQVRVRKVEAEPAAAAAGAIRNNGHN
ncbi:hypothetical protein U9M48_020565 [Paspalum notatum var. saurae]|uniref:SIAH-type domain-containing protein n=1 Tax=Paspalum notatum var. saurae TaxID=547442 RepID=A0AAQ3TIG0_PASNO